MKALIGALCLVVLAIAGYAYWLHRSLHPLMSSKGVAAELRTFVAPDGIESTESIDLGFARFELPRSLASVPTVGDDSLFVTFGRDTVARGLVVGPPVSDTDPDVVGLQASIAQLTGEQFETSYALRQRVLSIRPFTVFDIPFKGRRQTAQDAAMLLLKDGFSIGAQVVWQGETERVGLFWAPGERINLITVFDKKRRITQEFLLDSDSQQASALAAVLLMTYRFVSDANDEGTWKAEAQKAGVRFKPYEAGSDMALLSEDERLERIAAEVRARRAQRKVQEQ